MSTPDDPLATLLDPSRRPRRWWQHTGRVAAAVVALVALVVSTVIATQAGGSEATYRTATAQVRDVSSELSGVASVEPVSQATVAFPISGTVTAVDVAKGSTVSVGQTLASLDTTTLTNQLHTQQSALAQAELVLHEALTGAPITGSSSVPQGGSASSGTHSATTASAVSGAHDTGIVLTAAVSGTNATGNATPPTDDQLHAAQHAVVDGQAAVDAALGVAATDMTTADTMCTNVTTDAAVSTCHDALNDVLTAEQAVTTAQNALATASTKLDAMLSERAAAPTTSTTVPTTPSSLSTASGGTRSDRSSSASTTSPASGSSSGSTARSTGSRSSASSSTSTRSGASSTASSSPSAADLVKYQQAIDAAAANVAAAEQAIAQATIASPIAGTVVAVDMAPGDDVTSASSTENIVVVGPGGFEATTTVGVDQISEVKVGQAATVTPDGSTYHIAAKVVAVSVGVDPSSTSTTVYRVTLGLLDPEGSTLADGATGDVSITTDTTHAGVAVPASAVTTVGRRHTVVVLTNGKPVTTEVQIGAVGATWTAVTQGIDAGTRVVLAQLDEPLPTSATQSTNTTSTSNRRVGAAITGGFAPPTGARFGD
jgi:HlyD family secretion protein